VLCKECHATGGVPRLVPLYICIIRELRFHSFGVLGFGWSLCVRCRHSVWCYTVAHAGREEEGGEFLLSGHLVNLARKEKKKTTDLKTLTGFTVCFFANNRWRSQGR
jgi:hypothetical protein